MNNGNGALCLLTLMRRERDEVPWVMVVLVLVLVAAYVVWLVIKAVVWFLVKLVPPLISGGLGFILIYWIGTLRLTTILARSDTSVQLITVQAHSGTLTVNPHQPQLRRVMLPFKGLGALACVSIGGIILYSLSAEMREPSFDSTIKTIGYLVVGAALLVLTGFLWVTLDYTTFMSVRLRRASKGFEELCRVSKENAELAAFLDVRFVQTGVADVKAFIASHTAGNMAGPALITLLGARIDEAHGDRDNLDWAVGRSEDVAAEYHRVRRVVGATRRRSLSVALERTWQRFDRNKARYLPDREWKKFSEAADSCVERFKKLERQTEDPEDRRSRAHDASNPYDVLRLRPTASPQEVQDVYRKLSKIYHPDVGLTPDGEVMKDINKAYEKIMKKRSKH